MTLMWNFFDVFNATFVTNFVFVVMNEPILTNPTTVASLWNRASLRIAVDGGADYWKEFVTKHDTNGNLPLPDYITGDFVSPDSINPDTKAYYEQKGVKIIQTIDENETDYTKAIRHTKRIIDSNKLHVRWVVALLETTGRLDHILANLDTLYQTSGVLGHESLINMASNSATWLLQPGDNEIHVADNYPAMKYWCGLIPLSGPTQVTTTGLRWNLNNGTLAFGQLVSTSNRFSSSEVKVTTDKPLLWTMEHHQ